MTSVTLYIPHIFHPHNIGEEYGSYMLPAYTSLEELRKYHPEPISFFVSRNVTESKFI